MEIFDSKKLYKFFSAVSIISPIIVIGMIAFAFEKVDGFLLIGIAALIQIPSYLYVTTYRKRNKQ